MLSSSRQLHASPLGLVLGFVFLSLSVRAPFSQIGPLGAAVPFPAPLVATLGLIPPLVMGFSALLASKLRHRLGDERALTLAAAVVLIGCLLRSAGFTGLLAGTIVAAAGIGVMNVLIPVLVRTRFPAHHTGTMMAVYALAMGGGSALVGFLTLPLYQNTGSWPLAIALAAVPALLALLAFAPQYRHKSGIPAATASPRSSARTVAGSWLAWSLLFFFGIQSLLFYTALAWLPTVLRARGLELEASAAALQLMILAVAFGGALGALLAGRLRDQRLLLALTALVSAAGLFGIALAPEKTLIAFALLLGLGLGAGQAVPGVLYAKRGEHHAHTASLSTFAQFGGFLLAAGGPGLASALFSATSSWTVVVLGLAALAVIEIPLSLRAGRD